MFHHFTTKSCYTQLLHGGLAGSRRVSGLKRPGFERKALKPDDPTPPGPPKKVVKVYRNVMLQQKKLESNSEIDAYVNELRDKLYDLLKGNDQIDVE